MLYELYQAQEDLAAPSITAASFAQQAIAGLPPSLADTWVMRWTSAACEMVSRARLTHTRPPFGIDEVLVEGLPVKVREDVADDTPFGSLIHFAKDTRIQQPRILVAAALAGHFSTLLRATVRSLLSDFDVYITDWHNARDVPLAEGTFGFDEYVDHLIRFLGRVGPGAHLLAVCQPCPAALTATAVMAEAGDPLLPRSLTLIAGPVDTRINPTRVNEMATARPLSWFEDNVITSVPLRYAGAGRRVYPGFVQLGAFMSMNATNHLKRQVDLFCDLLTHETEKADKSKAFYDEYFAVLDMPAEFYLQTVDTIFQRHLLPRGELRWHGSRVDMSAISKTALLTVEGALDDICGVGQTMAAQDVCRRIPARKRRHHLQPGVGHYGVFSGKLWDLQVCPVVGNFVMAND